MKKNILIVAVAIVAIVCGIAAYFYWLHSPAKNEQQAQVPPVVAVPPAPTLEKVIEAPPEPPVLPKLSESDKTVRDILSGLLNNESLLKLFHPERIIRNIVATIDNLPRKRVSANIIPVKRPPGPFLTAGTEEEKTISPKNAARYAAYVKIAEVIPAQKLVEIYVRFYPLFQQAYEELGYPKKYFNDRLLAVLDHLLAAPEPKEPVKLDQPGVFYLYADAELEARSAGQKILMRIGAQNELKIKAKLREIKQQVLLNMRDRKTGDAK